MSNDTITIEGTCDKCGKPFSPGESAYLVDMRRIRHVDCDEGTVEEQLADLRCRLDRLEEMMGADDEEE